jgi:hypothetical protein
LGIVRIFVPWSDGRTDVVSGVLIDPWWVVTVAHAVGAAAPQQIVHGAQFDASQIAGLRAFAPDPLSDSTSPVLALPAFDYVAMAYLAPDAADFPGDVVALHLSRPFAPPGMTFPKVLWRFYTELATPLSRYGYGPVFNEQLFGVSTRDDGFASNPYDGWQARLQGGATDPGNAGAPVFNPDGAVIGIELGFITSNQYTSLYQPFGPGDQGTETLEGYFVLPLALPTKVVWGGGNSLVWSNYIINHPDQDWSNFGGYGLAGYRVFYKYASDGDSWARAITKDVQGMTTQLARLDVNPSDTTLWKFTVLPLAWTDASHTATSVMGAKSQTEQYPPDGDRGGSTAWGTFAYAFPYALSLSSASANGVVLSWAPTEYIEGHPDISGYQIFLKSASDGDTWSNAITAWADPGATSTILSPLNADEWVVTILPMVGDTILGVGSDGLPFPGAQSNMSVRYAPPQVVGQYPNGAGQAFIPLDGAGSISARFTNSGVGTTYQWEYSVTPEGAYGSDRDWSHTNGGTRPTLWFGGLDAPGGQAQASDTGWYRLKATNGLGTSYSQPVHVVIDTSDVPVLMDQSPAAGQEILQIASLPQDSNSHINQIAMVRFSGMQKENNPAYEWQTSSSRYEGYTTMGGPQLANWFNILQLVHLGPLWVRCKASNREGSAYSEPFLVVPQEKSSGVQRCQHPGPFAQVIAPLQRNSENAFLFSAYITSYAATDLIYPPGVYWSRSDTLTGTLSQDGEWTSHVYSNDSLLGFLGDGYSGITGAYAFFANDGYGYFPPMYVVAIDGDGSPRVLGGSATAGQVRGRAGRVGTAQVVWVFTNMYGVANGYALAPQYPTPGDSNTLVQSAGGFVLTSIGVPGTPARVGDSRIYVLQARNAYGTAASDTNLSPLQVTIDPEGVTNWGASNMTSTGLTDVGSSGALIIDASNGVNTPSSVRATGTFIRVISLPTGLALDTTKTFTWDPWDGGGGEPLATVDETGTIVTWNDLSYGGLVQVTDAGTTITLQLIIPDSEQDNWPGTYDYSRAKPISIPVVVLSEAVWGQAVTVQWSVSDGTVSTDPGNSTLGYYLGGAPELTSQAPVGGDTVVAITGSAGALAITAHFDTDRSGDTFQWERASSPDGPWSPDMVSPSITGQNTRVLTFGGVSTFDQGWYRLTATSWTDEVGYSTPIRVSTNPRTGWQSNPQFLSQVPAGNAGIEIGLGSVGDVSISAFPQAAGAGSLQWEWSFDGASGSFNSKAHDWSRTTGQNSTTLTFGVAGDNGGVMVADFGWYRLAWNTGTAAGTIYSNPVQLIPDMDSQGTLGFVSPQPMYYQGTDPIPVFGMASENAVTVTVNGDDYAFCGVEDGLWEADAFNRDGQYEMVATQESIGAQAFGDGAPARVLFSRGSAPPPQLVAAPVFTSPQANGNYADPVPVTGTGLSGALILLTVNGAAWKTLAVVDGEWNAGSLDWTGEITLTATQVFANVFSTPATATYVLLPDPVFTCPQSGAMYYYNSDNEGSGVAMTGTGAPGATVTVSYQGKTQGTPATVDKEGRWHAGIFSPPVPPPLDLSYTLNASQTLDSHTSQPVSVTFFLVALLPPGFTSPVQMPPDFIYENSVEIRGNGLGGAQIMLTLNGEPWGADENPDGVSVGNNTAWDAGVFWPEDATDYPPSGNAQYAWVMQATEIATNPDGSQVVGPSSKPVSFNCSMVIPPVLDMPTVVFPKTGVQYTGGNGPIWYQGGAGIPVVGGGFTGGTVTVTVDGTVWKENVPIKDGMWSAGTWNKAGHHDMTVTQSVGNETSAPATLSFDYEPAPGGLPDNLTIIQPKDSEHFGTATGLIYGRGVEEGARLVTVTLNGDYWQTAPISALADVLGGGGPPLLQWMVDGELAKPGIWVLGVTQTVDDKTSAPTYVAFSIEN